MTSLELVKSQLIDKFVTVHRYYSGTYLVFEYFNRSERLEKIPLERKESIEKVISVIESETASKDGTLITLILESGLRKSVYLKSTFEISETNESNNSN